MTLAPVQVALLQTFGFSLSTLLAAVVDYAYYVLLAFLVAWVLICWFPAYPSSSFLQAVYDVVGRVVDPIMRPIRSVLPPLNLGGMALDFSPCIGQREDQSPYDPRVPRRAADRPRVAPQGSR